MATTKKRPTKKTPRADRSVSDTRMESEEKLSPEAIRYLNKRVSNSNPPYLLILLIIALAAFSAYLFKQVQDLKKSAGTVANGQAQPQPTRPTELKIKKPSTKDDHWRGDKNARYVLVEYSDFECPFCQRIQPDLTKYFDENKDKVAFVYRHYPLPFHPKAQPSAEAAECATQQGGDEAFWKFHDVLFSKINDTEIPQIPDLAADAGLDPTQLKECVDAKTFEKKVKDQQNEGTQAGIQATPSTVIYDMKTGKNKLVEGAVPYDSLKSEFDGFLAQNK